MNPSELIKYIETIPIGLWISILILIFTAFIFLWNWQAKRKTKPVIRYMTYRGNKHYFNVTIYNNATHLLKIKKAFRRRFWWNKRLSVGTTDVNNKSHSNVLAKEKRGNLDLSREGKEDTFKLYLDQDEIISKQTFVFKTNAGTSRYTTKKIPVA